ncbi:MULTISPECIES: hypothetical protein [unclassified Fibrobacter]|uniref:hypothetical protein n=1 Tax=unclassified Fibrobacter TaxID=2634177 RepID=UPI00091A1003|nr:MULTISPECIES: hypothetical protein [unclassified Fibrobacter]OWV04522.1 hypothetical protein B7993_10905 [Fibrobacter sp. UWH3]SHL36736.1 hypothetical protein SAMN05720765_11381 [Fibrobacter sp. UWH6]
MNIFKNLAVMSIAAIMLIACGGDNGSSAKDDEIIPRKKRKRDQARRGQVIPALHFKSFR